MIRTFITILTILTAIGIGKAQETKAWSGGPLTWSDFRGSPMMENSPSFIAVDIALTNTGQSEAIMFPEQSYAAQNERTPQKLSYFQTQFNLAELLALKLQQEISLGLSSSEMEARLNYYRDFYKTESQRLSRDTNSGANEAALHYCASNVQQQLEELTNPADAELKASPLRYGLWVGTGFVATTSDISKYFNTAWDFSFGVLVDWRRFGLEGSLTFASPTIKDHSLTPDKYVGEGYYANVKNANYLAIGFNGGYNVLDTKSFLIRPYIGGMWTSYSWTARKQADNNEGGIILEGPQQSMKLTNFNVTFGVNFEWHFHRAVTSFPFLNSSREEYISSLRLTPYAIHSVYNNASSPFSGWQVGLTVAYSGVGRSLHVK